MQHSVGRLTGFGVSFLSTSFLSFKFSIWGLALWTIYVPSHPMLDAALILGLLVVPWFLLMVRMADAAVEHAIEEQQGWSFGDEAEDRYWEKTDDALQQSFGWLVVLEVHPVSRGIITGGASGVSVSIVKVVFPTAAWLTIAACLVISFLLLCLIAVAYWRRAAEKMASGLNDSLKELYPWMSDQSKG